MLIHLIVILFPWYFRTIPEKKANEGFQFWEAHHFFTGSLLATIGFFLIFKMSVSNFVSGPLLFFGTWLMVDDWIQHMAQKAEIEVRRCLFCRDILALVPV